MFEFWITIFPDLEILMNLTTNSILYVFSFISMIGGLICAVFHGIFTRDGKKVSERVAEFGRNALIQMSAMIFTLATALYIYDGQNKAKALEQANLEKSIAYSAIAIRAGIIENKVRSFVVSNKITIDLPRCIYRENGRRQNLEKKATRDLDDDCKKLLLREAYNAGQNYGSIRNRFDNLSDALNLKEDWIKYPYFTRNLDKVVLKGFLNLQAILNYRDANAMEIIAQFKNANLEQYSADKIIYDVERYNKEILNYSKTSIIYMLIYYLSFGQIDSSSTQIEQRQKIVIDGVRADFELYDKLSIGQFINTLSLRSQDCEFQSFKCYELLAGLK